MNKVIVSICIPAYKRVFYLKRLLDSIAEQTFRNFEVIISDDSPDNSVEVLLSSFTSSFTISYLKNAKPLGTPANWNFAISKATGEWIKLMHDDDWFSSPQSLQIFVNETKKGNKFIFSAYSNVMEESGETQKKHLPFLWSKRILYQPMTLLARNVIGPPSVTMVFRESTEKYDERMKWRVDMDFYVRVLKKESIFTYINKNIINVGVNEKQVTNECFENPAVELPEGFLLLQKYGANTLTNIFVYDAWWRLLRNMQIKTLEQLNLYGARQWPNVILKMLKHLNKVPPKLLRFGVISKLFMTFSFLFNFSKKE